MVDQTADMSGTEYEHLARDIYHALLHNDGVKTVDVKHNIDIAGRSGCSHQIDVYWEFSLGGVIYKTAIECKRYNKPLEIGRVRDFYAALTDIGNIQGIVITTIGYQAGAKKFADYYGINLQELRTPTDADWKGKLRDLNLRFIIFEPKIESVGAFNVDDEWYRANLAKGGQQVACEISGLMTEIGLHDAEGNLVRSWYQIERDLPQLIFKSGNVDPSLQVGTYTIDAKGLFMPHPTFGLVPLNSVNVDYSIGVTEIETKILGAEIVKFILRDLKSGHIHRFKANGGDVELIQHPDKNT